MLIKLLLVRSVYVYTHAPIARDKVKDAWLLLTNDETPIPSRDFTLDFGIYLIQLASELSEGKLLPSSIPLAVRSKFDPGIREAQKAMRKIEMGTSFLDYFQRHQNHSRTLAAYLELTLAKKQPHIALTNIKELLRAHQALTTFKDLHIHRLCNLLAATICAWHPGSPDMDRWLVSFFDIVLNLSERAVNEVAPRLIPKLDDYEAFLCFGLFLSVKGVMRYVNEEQYVHDMNQVLDCLKARYHGQQDLQQRLLVAFAKFLASMSHDCQFLAFMHTFFLQTFEEQWETAWCICDLYEEYLAQRRLAKERTEWQYQMMYLAV